LTPIRRPSSLYSMKYDFLFDSLRRSIAKAAPNYVMRDDLVRLEGRVDELVHIAEGLEQQLRQHGFAPRHKGRLSALGRTGETPR
jgi:hypothetical protein